MPPAQTSSEARKALRWFINHPVTDHVVFCLIIFSVCLLFLEIIDPSDFLYYEIGLAINIIFAIELGIRYIAFASKRAYLRTYWIDLLSLTPLLIPGANYLRALRILRIFRLGPLMRQSNRRLGSLFRRTSGEQITILSIILVVVVGVTLGMVGTEEEFASLHEAFWWTLLSVVAGEPIGATPATPIGRFFTLIVIFGGITIFALFTGTVSAVITERLRVGAKETSMNVEELEDHVIICGWNRSAPMLINELSTPNSDAHSAMVLVAEVRPDFPAEQEANPRLFFIEGDYTRMETLKRAGVERAATAILLADRSVAGRSDQDRDARTILAAMLIEKLRPGIFTCAELLSRENEQHLRLAGIEEVVIGDEYSASILATSSRVEGVTEIIDEIFSTQYGNQIYKREIREEWVGLSFLELQNRVKLAYNALILAVEKAPDPRKSRETPAYQRTITNPPAGYEFQPGDLLIIVSPKEPAW